MAPSTIATQIFDRMPYFGELPCKLSVLQATLKIQFNKIHLKYCRFLKKKQNKIQAKVKNNFNKY